MKHRAQVERREMVEERLEVGARHAVAGGRGLGQRRLVSIQGVVEGRCFTIPRGIEHRHERRDGGRRLVAKPGFSQQSMKRRHQQGPIPLVDLGGDDGRIGGDADPRFQGPAYVFRHVLIPLERRFVEPVGAPVRVGLGQDAGDGLHHLSLDVASAPLGFVLLQLGEQHALKLCPLPCLLAELRVAPVGILLGEEGDGRLQDFILFPCPLAELGVVPVGPFLGEEGSDHLQDLLLVLLQLCPLLVLFRPRQRAGLQAL